MKMTKTWVCIMGTGAPALPKGLGTMVRSMASKLQQLLREMRTEGHNRVRKREEGAGKADAFPESIDKVNN